MVTSSSQDYEAARLISTMVLERLTNGTVSKYDWPLSRNFYDYSWPVSADITTGAKRPTPGGQLPAGGAGTSDQHSDHHAR